MADRGFRFAATSRSEENRRNRGVSFGLRLSRPPSNGTATAHHDPLALREYWSLCSCDPYRCFLPPRWHLGQRGRETMWKGSTPKSYTSGMTVVTRPFHSEPPPGPGCGKRDVSPTILRILGIRTAERYGRTCPKSHPQAPDGIWPLHPRGNTVAVRTIHCRRYAIPARRTVEASGAFTCEEAPDRCKAIPTIVLVPGRSNGLWLARKIRCAHSPSCVLPRQPREVSRRLQSSCSGNRVRSDGGLRC